jgi:2-phospho-L-lactate transferase/gluconeogenesis factor (CofD/UPF0052 family)
MNVVIFTGGNGNANLIKHLKDLSYVNLSLLINGYDDGLSTGVIRSANQGMLGPSDYRKNFTYILDDFTDYNRNLKKLFEHRLSEEETRVLLHNPDELIKKLIQENYALDRRSENFITRYFEFGSQKLLKFTHNFSILNGFSVGNIIIGGIYAETNDFNLALYLLTTQFELTAKIINISTADDSKLVAFDAEDNFLANEADIVNFEGNKPLSDFYLLPLDELNALDKQSSYSQAEIARISKIPAVSKEALKALKEADLIIFGSGTQFSSLLPSYRICKNAILKSKAQKVLIVNNNYDNDIRNIKFDEFTQKILREINQTEIDFFDSIIVDDQSVIKPINSIPNVMIAHVADPSGKHDGQKLWTWINRSLDIKSGEVPVLISFAKNTEKFIKEYYHKEMENLNSDPTRIIKFYQTGEKEISSYTLHLDASGKISLYEIDAWIRIMQLNQLDAVIGSRFESRRQLINSFKHSIVESNLIYLFALMTSYWVSIIYFIRFWRIMPDPLSGIYLIKSTHDIPYKNLSYFLKKIHRKKNFEFVSLPISYRTFKKVKILTKIKNVIVNLFGLYV